MVLVLALWWRFFGAVLFLRCRCAANHRNISFRYYYYRSSTHVPYTLRRLPPAATTCGSACVLHRAGTLVPSRSGLRLPGCAPLLHHNITVSSVIICVLPGSAIHLPRTVVSPPFSHFLYWFQSPTVRFTFTPFTIPATCRFTCHWGFSIARLVWFPPFLTLLPAGERLPTGTYVRFTILPPHRRFTIGFVLPAWIQHGSHPYILPLPPCYRLRARSYLPRAFAIYTGSLPHHTALHTTTAYLYFTHTYETSAFLYLKKTAVPCFVPGSYFSPTTPPPALGLPACCKTATCTCDLPALLHSAHYHCTHLPPPFLCLPPHTPPNFLSLGFLCPLDSYTTTTITGVLDRFCSHCLPACYLLVLQEDSFTTCSSGFLCVPQLTTTNLLPPALPTHTMCTLPACLPAHLPFSHYYTPLQTAHCWSTWVQCHCVLLLLPPVTTFSAICFPCLFPATTTLHCTHVFVPF